MQQLDKKVGKCRLGVAWVDLLELENELKFGDYNDRPESENETNKIIASFRKIGIASMKESSAIPVILERSRIAESLELARDFSDPDSVPELKLKDSNKIVVASGQHRCSALMKYWQSLEDDLDMIRKRMAKIAVLKNLEDHHVKEHSTLRDDAAQLMGFIRDMGKWGVTIYDRGKCHVTAIKTVTTAV